MKAPSTPLAAALWALEEGLWPVPITPYDDRRSKSPGKAPIGKAWGVERPDPDFLRATFRRTPKAGVGLKLGADGLVVDLDVDDPAQAGPVLARLFPDGPPPTLRWENAAGRFHLLFRYNARLAALGKAIVKGGEHYPGLEVRIGAPPGDARQLQSVIPPSLMTNGAARRWAHWGPILALPEAVIVDLEARAIERPRVPPLSATSGRPGPGSTPIEVRASKYLARCDPGISGQDGHNATFKACCKMVEFGLDEGTAYRMLAAEYNPRCEPPWSETELQHKVADAFRENAARHGAKLRESRNGHHAPATNGKYSTPPISPKTPKGIDDLVAALSRGPINLTDTGNSLRLVRDHGDKIRYCVEWGKWLRWDGRRWKEDRTGSVYRLARRTIQRIGAEAAESAEPDERKALLKWAITSEARKHVDAMIHLARFVEGIPVETSQLDCDPWLLNVRNGTIDLRTGGLRPHRREDLITKLADANYDPAAACLRWDQFEREIMDGDEAMVGYIRRIAGYGITGDVREHQLFFFHGEGRNGKSMWLGVVHRLLGDYATTINSSLITVKQHDDHPTGLTDLEGRRFVSTIEVADGRKMAEALVKQLTGGDPIKARRMRQDHYSFMPTHKIILAANHKPDIRETTEAIWERVKLIPFPVTFVEADRVDLSTKRLLKDKALEEKLWAEAPGILATLVRACLEWQRDGLKEPEAVVRATAGYRAEMDRLTDFIAERCLVSEGVRVKANPLYEAYRTWAKESGETEITKRKFGSNMEHRGFGLIESNGVRWRRGIALKVEDGDAF